MAPLLSLLEFGAQNPGVLRPLKGVASNEHYFVFSGIFFRALPGGTLGVPVCPSRPVPVAFGWRRGRTKLLLAYK